MSKSPRPLVHELHSCGSIIRMASSDATAADLPLTGYYGNDWLWGESSIDMVKTFLLFFDKMVMTLPAHLIESALSREPVLAPALYEMGLLVNIEPDEWLDERTAKHKIVAPLRRALKADADQEVMEFAFDYTSRSLLTDEHFIRGNNRATRALVRTLIARGLMTRQSAQSLIEIRPDVRQFILMQLAAAFIGKGGSLGMDLNLIEGPPAEFGHPWWVDHRLPYYVHREWRHHARFRAILSDLSNVSVDLSAVPLDEVIDFRRRHGYQYRAYMRKLRSFANDYSESSQEVVHRQLLDDRSEELRDEAADLWRLSSRGFSKSFGVVAVSGAGIAWGVRESDAVAAVLSALASLMSLPLFAPPKLTPFAYIFDIEERFGDR